MPCDFAPISDTRKACNCCGCEVTLDAPEPIFHDCTPRGAGDMVARLTDWLGLAHCAACSRRQAILNRWLPFARDRATIPPAAEPDRAALDRLKVCDGCDQRVADLCTLKQSSCLALATQPDCPLGKWPDNIPAVKLSQPTAREPAWPWLDSPCAIRLQFPHGLGDHVQFTAVLAHLAHHWPHVAIDAQVRPGCESLFRPFCRAVTTLAEALPPSPHPYAFDKPVRWPEPVATSHQHPASKVERFLSEVLRVAPLPDLNRYYCPSTPDQLAAAYDYLADQAAVGRAVLIQPRGRCGERLKNLDDTTLAAAIAAVRAAGCVPILLDFDRRLPPPIAALAPNLADAPQLWPAGPIADAGQIAAVSRLARLNVGIDSGPGKIFTAHGMPPAIINWIRLHPINYSTTAPHVLHLVPQEHDRFIRGDRETGRRYFTAHYRHDTYTDLPRALPAAITRALKGWPTSPD